MSVYYDLYETPDLAKSGDEQPLHARVVLKGSYTANEFVEQVYKHQHIPHAQLVGAIEAISSELRDLLLKGLSVELGDIGYFSLSLKTDKKVLDPKKLRSPSVSLKDINLRINRGFKKDIGSRLELVRFHSPARVKNPLGEAECLQRLNKFLEEHPCINRRDYAALTGKTKKQALQDINVFIDSGILKRYGVGRSVVYITGNDKIVQSLDNN